MPGERLAACHPKGAQVAAEGLLLLKEILRRVLRSDWNDSRIRVCRVFALEKGLTPSRSGVPVRAEGLAGHCGLREDDMSQVV